MLKPLLLRIVSTIHLFLQCKDNNNFSKRCIKGRKKHQETNTLSNMSAIRAYYRDIHSYTLTDCNLIRFLIKAETNMNNVNNSPINKYIMPINNLKSM